MPADDIGNKVQAPKDATIPLDNPAQSREIWVGFEKSGRHFLDKETLELDAGRQIHQLGAYYQQLFSRFKRAGRKWVRCELPIVMLGELSAVRTWCHLHSATLKSLTDKILQVTPSDIKSQHFPHQTQFDRLEKSDVLTRSFANPETLVDHEDFFLNDTSFHVGGATSKRRVLFISHEIDKKQLVLPFIVALLLVVLSTVVTGLKTKSASTAAEVGALVGGCFVFVETFMTWLLS